MLRLVQHRAQLFGQFRDIGALVDARMCAGDTMDVNTVLRYRPPAVVGIIMLPRVAIAALENGDAASVRPRHILFSCSESGCAWCLFTRRSLSDCKIVGLQNQIGVSLVKLTWVN